MSESVRARIESTVPFAVTRPDRIDARRYHDREFYELEREKLWPHVWQMACRLQEIERPGDFVVYEIFDESVPGKQLNRVCASGLEAINTAAAQIMAGQSDLTIGGGMDRKRWLLAHEAKSAGQPLFA